MSPSVQPSQTAVSPPAAPITGSPGNVTSAPAHSAQATARAQTATPAGPVTALPPKEGAERVSGVTGKPSAQPVSDHTGGVGSNPTAPARKPSAALAAWLGPTGISLAPKAAEFNRYPTRYAHSSWIPENWGPRMQRMTGNGRAEAKLGESLMGAWKLDARPCFDFAHPARRMALMDAAPLQRTVLLAGLARHADEISRLMERSRVMDLKNQVGDDAYKFVTFRASLLAGPLAAGGNAAAPGHDWRARSMAAGLGMFGACLGGGRDGVAARVGLKFPREYAPFLAAGGGEGSVDGYMRLFRKVLAQEVDPAWDNLLS